jgi:two-component sensor histidine kinase
MRTIYTAILLLLFNTCEGQDITQNILPGEAMSLEKSLHLRLPDTVKIDKMIGLAYFYILKPGESKHDLDSAKNYLDQAILLDNASHQGPLSGRLMIAQSHLLRERGQRQEGKQTIEKAIKILIAGRNKRDLGLAYIEMAQYYNYNIPAEIVAKLRFVTMAVELFRLSGDIKLKAYSLKLLADLHNFNGDGEKALKEATLALTSYQAIGHKQLQDVYELIGSIYYQKGDYVQSLNYHLKALQTAISEKDSTMQLCQINNGIGMAFMRLKNYPKAINYLKAAMPVAEKINDRSTVISLTFNIAESYISQGKVKDALIFLNGVPQAYIRINNISEDFPIAIIYLEIYTALKDFSKGVWYSKKLSNVAEIEEINTVNKNYIYTALIKYYTAAREFKAAERCIFKNQLLLVRLKNSSGLARNYQAWFKLDTMQRNYVSAVKHLLLHNHLADSISMENQKVDLKRLTNFYETAQKENAIKLLQARTRLQEIKLQHAEYSRKWFLGLALTLFLVLVILIDRYIVKRKMNNVLKDRYSETRLVNQNLAEEKNDLIAEKDDLLTQKEWLLAEIHHRVRNNLHTVISLLESQAAFLKNDALNAIEKSQHRIYAMSLIHQKIYSDEHLKAVDISGFITELIRYLNDSYGTHREIHFELDLEPVKVGITQAIPLALIINEVITNAILHAFNEKSSRRILVSIHKTEEFATLIIADNGIGINFTKNSMPSNSLGLVLINGLSEDINADIQIVNDHGTKVTLVLAMEYLLEPQGYNYT